MFAKVDRATTVGKPSHDELVRSDELLAVYAEVQARLVRPARHRQSPRNEGPCVVGPARLDREARKVRVLSLPHHLLARSARNFLRGHVHHLSSDRNPALEHIAKSLGRLRFPEEREELSDIAQRLARVHAYLPTHGEGNAARRDRKSTRLNSSHSQISYAVFCLKKKKQYTLTISVVHSHNLS